MYEKNDQTLQEICLFYDASSLCIEIPQTLNGGTWLPNRFKDIQFQIPINCPAFLLHFVYTPLDQGDSVFHSL